MTDETTIASIRKNSREDLRVTLKQFEGHDLVDVRVWAEPSMGSEPVATRKGVSVRVALLPELIEALQDAEDEARRRGWLEQEPDDDHDADEARREADRMNPLAAG